jgi:hypothetical protein
MKNCMVLYAQKLVVKQGWFLKKARFIVFNCSIFFQYSYIQYVVFLYKMNFHSYFIVIPQLFHSYSIINSTNKFNFYAI